MRLYTSGSLAEVPQERYEVVHVQDQQMYIKELGTRREATLWNHPLTRNANDLRSIKREIEVHSRFDHSTVAKFLRVEFIYEFDDPDPARREARARAVPGAFQRWRHDSKSDPREALPISIGLLVEHGGLGTLETVLDNEHYFNEETAMIVFGNIMNGVKHMHDRGVCHRNLFLDNIFIFGDPKSLLFLKLSGFSNAKSLEYHSQPDSRRGEIERMAPEVYRHMADDRYIGTKVDIWALGLLLYRMLFGVLPMIDDQGERQVVLQNGTIYVPPGFTPAQDLLDLLQNMLQSDPNLRPTANDILSHPWAIRASQNLRPFFSEAELRRLGSSVGAILSQNANEVQTVIDDLTLIMNLLGIEGNPSFR